MNNKHPSGTDILDTFLAGGYDTDILSAIYGPSGSGKTLFCLLASISTLRKNKKVIFIDTEGGFSIERFKQLAPDDHLDLLSNIIILRPVTFTDQKNDFRKLKDIVNDSIGLVIVDTISALYRQEFTKENVYETNTELIQQLSYLTEIARKRNIPVIVASQIYDNLNKPGTVSMVGGKIAENSAKCLIELKKAKNNARAAIIKKHRSLPENKELIFKIVQKGIEKEESIVL